MFLRTATFQLLFIFMFNGCIAQSSENYMEAQNNKKTLDALICDTTTHLCGTPSEETGTPAVSAEKTIKIVYFTDPICSSCWGIEPQLRKLKLEYGKHFVIEYRMGGLLPDWSYNSGGISKPADVARHWDEVSPHYEMPIDGDVWLEDPLNSSYPPSIAFKAAQMQDSSIAIAYLRRIREMVFLEKKNITKWEHLIDAASFVDLDLEQFKLDYHDKARSEFYKDLDLAKEYGVRGFPTLFISDSNGKTGKVYGARAYENYEQVITDIDAQLKKQTYDTTWTFLFAKYNSLTLKEYAVLSGQTMTACEKELNELTSENILTLFTTKNGSIWRKNTSLKHRKK